MTHTLYVTAAIAGTLSAIHAALLWYAGFTAGGSAYLPAITAPPNTDRDHVPRRTGRPIPAHAPRWGYDTKPVDI